MEETDSRRPRGRRLLLPPGAEGRLATLTWEPGAPTWPGDDVIRVVGHAHSLEELFRLLDTVAVDVVSIHNPPGGTTHGRSDPDWVQMLAKVRDRHPDLPIVLPGRAPGTGPCVPRAWGILMMRGPGAMSFAIQAILTVGDPCLCELPLTQREIRVVQAKALRRRPTEIAQELGIANSTLKDLTLDLLHRLGCPPMAHLEERARELGLLA